MYHCLLIPIPGLGMVEAALSKQSLMKSCWVGTAALLEQLRLVLVRNSQKASILECGVLSWEWQMAGTGQGFP